MGRDPREVLNPSQVGRKPACFDSAEQYREYMQQKKNSGVAHIHRGVCVDCTPEYQAQMLEEGRCTHPETVFVDVIDQYFETSVFGVSNISRWWPKVQKGQRVFRLYRNSDGLGDEDVQD